MSNPGEDQQAPSWLEPVWRSAADLLSAAEQWVVVGYSLPAYDVAIRDLLAGAASSQRVLVRDPMAADVAARFHALLPRCEVIPGPAI